MSEASPIGGARYFQGTPRDNALRAHRDAAHKAVEHGVRPDELLLNVIAALRGHSLPGRDDYDLARRLAAEVNASPCTAPVCRPKEQP